MCEKLSFPCHWIINFHDYGFNIEGVLCHICMRNVIWVWWCHEIHIWCITLYFHVPILCGLKSKKSICETLAFPCHWITSFHDFGSNLVSYLYEGCSLSLMILLQSYIMCYSVIFPMLSGSKSNKSICETLAIPCY